MAVEPLEAQSTDAHVDDASCRRAEAWVSFTPPRQPVLPSLKWREIYRHLQSELSLRGVALCTAPGTTAPVAELTLEARGASGVVISLHHTQEGTPAVKRRLVDLATLPADARLLAIAVATDELLRANWDSITNPAPRTAHQVDEASGSTGARDSLAEPGVVFALDVHSGGQKLFGADLQSRFRVYRQLRGLLQVGLRRGLSVRSENGRLDSTVLKAGAGLAWRLTPPESRLGADLLGAVDVMRVAFSAEANAGATALPRHDVAVVAGAGLGGQLVLIRRFALTAQVLAGGALRPVFASDTGHRVSGVSGLAISIGMGFVVRL